MPEKPSRDSAVRLPTISDRLEIEWVGNARQRQRLCHCDLQGTIADGPYVRPAETGEQIDIGGPAANPAQSNQLAPNFVVLLAREIVDRQTTIDDCLGKVAQVTVLLTRDTVGAQVLYGGGEKSFRLNFSKPDANPAVGRRRRGKRDLLFENKQHQAWKTGWSLPESWQTELFDDRPQGGVLTSEALGSGDKPRRIEWLIHGGKTRTIGLPPRRATSRNPASSNIESVPV